VTLPDTVTVQFAPKAELHPDHELKLLLPAVAGALKVSVVPELSVSAAADVPVVTDVPPKLIDTPVAGFALATVIV